MPSNNVYYRTSFKLKLKHVENPPDRWIRADGVFEGIVKPELFYKAQEIILARSQKFTDEEMLEKLRELLKRHGHISGILIEEADDLPSLQARDDRFQQPFHPQGVIVNPTQINIRGRLAIGQCPVKMFRAGFADGQSSDAVKVFVFDGCLPPFERFIRFLGDDVVHHVLPCSRSQLGVSAVQINARQR